MTLAPVAYPTELTSTSQRATTLATNLRAVAENVSDAHTRLQDGGRPADWEGEASQAAGHAMTVVVADLDAGVAALEQGSLAMDTYAAALVSLEQRFIALVDEIDAVNAQVAAHQSDRRTANAVPDADTTLLDQQQGQLQSATADLRARVAQWEADARSAHEEVVAALQRVDTVAEGDDAARAPGRPDAAGLADDLQALVDSGDPTAIADFWAGLDPAERQALTIHSPQLVGNADGVPVADRDVANRTSLYSDVDYLGQREADDQLSRNEADQLANARSTRDVLDEYRDDIDVTTGDHLSNLLVYKPGEHGGNGGVALSLGDPDLADDVAALVPGVTSEQASLAGNVSSMDRLFTEADAQNGDRSVATIAWLDYNAPSGEPWDPDDLLDVVQDSGDLLMTTNELFASAGGDRFADFVAGLRASDEQAGEAGGGRAHLTAIGHSYGSTTASYAATAGMDVDDLVLIGSPGAGEGNDEATDLLASGNVWVGAADHDPISHLGNPTRVGLGHDPAQEYFDAHRFEVDPGSYRVEDLFGNHSSYFDEGSDSLSNIAAVATGNDPTLVDGRHAPGTVTLPALLAGSSAASAGEQLVEHGDDLLRLLDPRGILP